MFKQSEGSTIVVGAPYDIIGSAIYVHPFTSGDRLSA